MTNREYARRTCAANARNMNDTIYLLAELVATRNVAVKADDVVFVNSR